MLDELNPVFSQAHSPAASSPISEQPVFLYRHFVCGHMAFNTAADGALGHDSRLNGPGQVPSPDDEKSLPDEKHVEQVITSVDNLVYDDVDGEPKLHARTYVALAAMFLLNLVQVVALQGPPAAVGDNGAAWPGRLY